MNKIFDGIWNIVKFIFNCILSLVIFAIIVTVISLVWILAF
jgi:hypothetical protein